MEVDTSIQLHAPEDSNTGSITDYRSPSIAVPDGHDIIPLDDKSEVCSPLRLLYLTFICSHILLEVIPIPWVRVVGQQTSINGAALASITSLCLVFNLARKLSLSNEFAHRLAIIFSCYNLLSFLFIFYEFIGGYRDFSETVTLVKVALYFFWLIGTVLELCFERTFNLLDIG